MRSPHRGPAPNRQDGANIERQQEKPRTGVSKHRCGLIEEVFRLIEVAGRKRYPRQPAQRIPSAQRNPKRLESLKTKGKQFASCIHMADRMFDIPEQALS
jgi:hypothetical protein